MKYCQQCGSENTDANKFCVSCGASLNTTDNTAAASSWTEQVQQAQQTQQVQQANPTTATFNTTGVSASVTLSDTDKTLRLVAFVFNCLSLAGFAIFIIPLAWMIPMTVVSWGIYKGTRRNTVAFGVCTLIFLNLVGGILLLCSSKDD